MSTSQVIVNNFSKIRFLSRVMYVLKDVMFIYTFFALCIKNLLFLSVLKSSGASKLPATFNILNIFKVHIFVWFILIFISFAFLAHNKLHLWSLVAINALYSIILVGDLWHYRGFDSFLSLHLLKETGNLNNLSQSILSMSRPIDLIFVVDIVVMIILAIFLRKYYGKMPKYRGTFVVLFIIPFFLIYTGPNLFKTQWIPYATMRDVSPIGYHFYDTLNFINDYKPYNLTKKDKSDIKAWYASKDENLPDNKYKGVFKGKNLIIIQVESLENFVINQKYQNQEITPSMNKLLKNSLYFSNYYEQVNNGTSSDADLMTNASVYPVRSGSTFFRFPNNAYNTLPKLLKKDGYTNKVFHSDHGYYWNVKNALMNFGFDEFKDQESFPIQKTFWMGLTDESFFDQSAFMLEKTKNPFYAFMVTSTSHIPFEMPKEFKNLKINPQFEKTKMGGYYQSVNYADKQIGKFIDSLDKARILDNTVVVIYGDHTSIHKYYGDEIAKIKPQENWWANGKRVPLIIYNKGLEGRELTLNGGQIDLLPTIAYTMGVKESDYSNTTLGRNLLKTNKSYALLADGTIIGKETLNKADIDDLNKAFAISDKLVRTNYFKK